MPQDFDCPTGTCGEEPICKQIKEGDDISSSSRAHLERNACNRCPSSNPTPVYSTSIWYDRHGNPRRSRRLTGFTDSEGNSWEPDNAGTAWIFHDDPFPGFRTFENMTYRVVETTSGGRGWQCRYVDGVLDDTTSDMGTFDYAPAPSGEHWSMDVMPHFGNSNYTPNLTEQF